MILSAAMAAAHASSEAENGVTDWIGKKVLSEIKCKSCAKATNMVSDLLYRPEL